MKNHTVLTAHHGTQGHLTQIFPTFPNPILKFGLPYEDGSRAVMGFK